MKSLPASLKPIALAIALVFLFSCSEKDHEPEQTCVFTGKTTSLNTGSAESKYGNEIILNDQKQLVSAKRTNSTEAFSGSTTWKWRRSTIYEYVPKYDAQGFLSQMVAVTDDLYEGKLGNSYPYKGRSFLKFKTETTETSEYKYESGRIASVSTVIVQRIQGDNDSPIMEETRRTKVYTYDSQNNPISALTTTATGTILTTFKNGIIASETQKNTTGAVTTNIQYNEKGLTKSMSSGPYLYEMNYDDRGNRVSVHFTQDGKPNFLQEYSYDDHKNPEIDIPVKFKGIPEEITTVRTTEGVNNMIVEKFTSYNGSPNYESQFIYQYNAAGLPESWTPKTLEGGQTMTATFHYKCQ